ncbi:MAG: hypothetical protein HQ464_08835 [Planctomycetes bacterium]|nr:hypothetical protein [Planctomycetota bacterium]
MTPSLSSGGTVVLSRADTALTSSPAGRCTTGCTEPPSQVEILARAVELVAAMRLSIEEATAVLAAVTARRPIG